MTELHILNPNWDEGLSRPRDKLFQQISTAKNAPQLQWQVYRKINCQLMFWVSGTVWHQENNCEHLNCGMRTRESFGQARNYTTKGQATGGNMLTRVCCWDSPFTTHLSFIEPVASQALQKNQSASKVNTSSNANASRSYVSSHVVHHLNTSSTTLAFWPVPHWLFGQPHVFFRRFDQGTGKDANGRSQLCTEEAFSIGEGHAWMMQDLQHPTNSRIRCSSSPWYCHHEGSFW